MVISVNEISRETLLAFESSWMNQLASVSENSVTFQDYRQLFNSIKAKNNFGNLLDSPGLSTYLAVTQDDGQTCLSILEVIYTKHGSAKWAKMVDAHFSPDIEDLPQADFNNQHENVLRAIITHLIKVLSLSDRDKVKIYARNDTSMAFIQQFSRHAVSANIAASGINVGLEGRWLVFGCN